MKIDLINSVLDSVPQVKAFLSYETIEAINKKTYEYMLQKVSALVRRAYRGDVSTPEFTDALTEIISGQMRNAYNSAWFDSELGGGTSAALPDYLESSLEYMIAAQSNMQWIYQYWKDINQARINNVGVDAFLSRAELWAARWNEAYNEAMRIIAVQNGQRLKWVEGDTEEKCDTCLSLDGIIAYASVWEQLGVKPQAAPNGKLICGGWKCQCYFEPTNEKVTRNASKRIYEAVNR